MKHLTRLVSAGCKYLQASKPLQIFAVNIKFRNFAWGVLAYNILVIIWGAYVRASRSGDGCGDHWPKCNGELIPNAASLTKTWVEYAHRGMTVVDGFLILALVIWAFRIYPKKHQVRLGASLSLGFVLVEALIGAFLVKFKLVAESQSEYRAVAMSLHLVNTLFLLVALTLTAWWAMGKPRIKLFGQGAMGFAIVANIAAVIALAVTGALAALGDTVFPAADYDELIRTVQRELAGGKTLQGSVHLFEHLRTFHPFTTFTVGLWLMLVCGLCGRLRPSPDTTRWMRWTVSLFAIQVSCGLLNLVLLAPIWLQMVHLLLADALWISLVLMSASALAVDCRQVEMESANQVREEIGIPLLPDGADGAYAHATWKDYLALTKPRVISLLLFTTLTAMFIGKGGWPGLWLTVATGLGLYMSAGAANAINMVCERDLDLKMERTSKRPTLTSVAPPKALWFAFALAIGSFALLWSAANLLAAQMALSGLVVYVIVYTLLLKRRTWSNIVIGGAAGAFPPLVGYAAVTDSLSPMAWVLFSIVFVWTPVHFWALALLIKDDYAKAGVPMLPVVQGDRNTTVQIGAYTIATIAISLLPFGLHEGGLNGSASSAGWIYLVAVVVLNAILTLRSIQLYQNPTRPRASSLFHYSMLYLALLFLALAVDRSVI